MPSERRDLFEFGPFTLDPEDGSLKRGGDVIRVPRKAADVLVVLLEDPGKVFSRSELIARVWDASVTGGSLDYQIHQIRQALGSEGSELVQNVPRRGFRFTGAVSRVSRQNHQPADRTTPTVITDSAAGTGSDAARPHAASHVGPIAVAVALAIVGIASIAAVRSTNPALMHIVESRPLTHDGPPRLGTPLLSDGRRLYFGRIEDGRRVAIPIAGGDSTIVFDSASEFWLTDPGSGAEYLAIKLDATGGRGEVWVIPTGSGVPHRVGTLVASDAVWSPDKRRIALVSNAQLRLADADGGNVADVTVPREGGIMYPRWSPDGTRVRFTVNEPRAGTLPHPSLWEVGRDGGAATAAFPEWDGALPACCGAWSPDGRYFVFEVLQKDTRTDLWARSEPSGLDAWLGRRPAMTQLTTGPLDFSGAVFSPDGDTIFAVGALRQGELVRWDTAAKTFVSYLPGVSGTWVTFSPDGQWIAYAGYPDRKLWRAKADGSDRRELVSGDFELDGVAWSPDGRWISFRSRMGGRHMKLYLIPSNGGRPEPVTPEDRDEGVASWSPDSRRIVFGDVPAQFGIPSGSEVLHVYDLQDKTTSSVPGSERLWTARWSPDGRHIAALTIDKEQRLKLFDTTTQRWKSTTAVHLNNPNFSRDGKVLFYDTEGGPLALRRYSIEDDKAVGIAPLDFQRPVYGWSGLAPDDAPFVLRNLTTPAVYALTIESRR